ncbi:MAG: cupin domain-containing protein [Hyphomicrobiales bacterium]|nr:cupin domain-containing protein [Hyphomicrobiales bacterium]
MMTKVFGVALAAAAFSISVRAEQVPAQIVPVGEIPWPKDQSQQLGSSQTPGLNTVMIVGDGETNRLYSIMFRVPPNARIAPHSHPDNRSCFVLTGLWRFAFGDRYDETKLLDLPPGSHYTEPGGRAHFAATGPQGALVQCTAVGPTATTFVDEK